MTACIDSTAMRAHLDHPDGRIEAHLDACPSCTGLLTVIAADAGATRQALASLDADVPDDVDADRALRAALARVPITDPSPAAGRPRRGAFGRSVARLGPRLAVAATVVGLAVAVAVTPAGRDAVAQALDGFRGEQLQVVQIDPSAIQLEPADLLALASLGDLDLVALSHPEPVADMAAAEAIAGIRGPVLTDPADQLMASAPGAVSLTLIARDGNGVPADLDGAALQVGVPGVIGAVYGTEELPRLLIGRAGSLQVDAVGAPLADIRAFLLDRPELPEQLRSQLAAIEDWQSTLPIPVPVDGPGWQDVMIGDRPGVAFGDGSGLGAMVLREDADGLTVVGGMLPIDEVLAIAAGA